MVPWTGMDGTKRNFVPVQSILTVNRMDYGAPILAKNMRACPHWKWMGRNCQEDHDIMHRVAYWPYMNGLSTCLLRDRPRRGSIL